MNLQELELSVEQLPPQDLETFSKWFEEFLAETWDRRIEADIAAGRLDTAGQQAEEDFVAGRCTPL